MGVIRDIDQLEDSLSQPSEALLSDWGDIDGDILILGVGGKMGPSLARMARRAADRAGVKHRVIGVSRFSNSALPSELHAHGIETIQGDLLSSQFTRSLPKVENVVHLVGQKFGTSGNAPFTWATNAYLPGMVGEHFCDSRVVALSTGNVYGLAPVEHGGSKEGDALQPVDEYAMSGLGRERIFEFSSRRHGTRVCTVRLNYATELRYGVLVDLAQKVNRQEPVPLGMGYFNVIWQRDACDMILRSFSQVANPPCYLNVTGPGVISCRKTCEQFGKLLDKPVRFEGSESSTALLSNAGRAIELFGPPATSLDEMLTMTADWIRRGGETWNKPTHFEQRDGKF